MSSVVILSEYVREKRESGAGEEFLGALDLT